MQNLSFHFVNSNNEVGVVSPKRKILVGVVSSGNLEIFIEPAPNLNACDVNIKTTSMGFDHIWQAVLADFFEKHPCTKMIITINDVGATPAIVRLRLDQAMEEITNEKAHGRNTP